jgi:hypothetical protein
MSIEDAHDDNDPSYGSEGRSRCLTLATAAELSDGALALAHDLLEFLADEIYGPDPHGRPARSPARLSLTTQEILLMHYKDNDREIRDPHFWDELAAMDYHPELTLSLPQVLSDQAAREFYDLLQNLADQFYEHYAKQINRAYETRDREREEFIRERQADQAQQELPFNDELDDLF